MAKTLEEALKILKFESGVSFEDAKKQWRRMAMRLHPDRNKATNATEEFKAAKGAWEYFESRFSSSTTCTWSTSSSSGRKSSYGESKKSDNAYYQRAKQQKQQQKTRSTYGDGSYDYDLDDEFDENDDDYAYDDYDKKDYGYKQAKVDPRFEYISSGSACEIGRAFFKSYFGLMQSKIERDNLSIEYDTKSFIQGIAELLSRYPLREIDVDHFAYEYCKALWSLQDETIFKFSTHVYATLRDASPKLCRVINPYTVISKPIGFSDADTFNALHIICTDKHVDQDPQRSRFINYIMEHYAAKDSPFFELGDKCLKPNVFYQEVLAARPHLIPLLMSHKCINFDSAVYEKAKLNPLRDILNSKMLDSDIGKTLVQGWSIFDKSLVGELKSLSLDKVQSVLNALVEQKPSSMAWIVDNFSKQWHPVTAGFKRVYTEYRKPIEENIDVIRLNERLAVDLLNQKYNEMNSMLYRVGQLCSNLFGKEKQSNVLDKLAESLGVSRDTLAKQFDEDKGEFVMMSEELYSGRP